MAKAANLAGQVAGILASAQPLVDLALEQADHLERVEGAPDREQVAERISALLQSVSCHMRSIQQLCEKELEEDQ